MNWSLPVARFLVRRASWLRASLPVVIALLLAVVVSRETFDSEILNLLPADRPAVEGMFIYQHEFAQSRELAFFFSTPDDPDLLAEFRGFFVSRLSQTPWVLRFLESAPMEMDAGRETLPEFALPLLIDLPEKEFQQLMGRLDEEKLGDRLAGLARRAQAGSPAANLELNHDPLGLLGSVTSRLLGSLFLEESFALTNADGTAQIISLITNQPELDAASCREMMAEVREFLVEVRRDFGPRAPEVWVTGRSAYVEEISASMRRDILLTSAVSATGISLLFLLAYGALRPLFGILLVLAVSALASLTFGLLLFPALNLIAIGFCSILFGLGNDFGLLLLEKIRSASERAGPVEKISGALRSRFPAILSVALTTAIGFLALTLSHSSGFTQLGVLTASGIFFCAIFMPLWLFLFVPRGWLAADSKPNKGKIVPLLSKLNQFYRPVLISSGVVFLLVLLVAILPWRTVQFDASPRSLEPENTPAAIALQKMMEAFPSTFEPVLLVVPFDQAAEGAAVAQKLETSLQEWKEEGLIAGFSGASVLLLQEARQQNNLQFASALDWEKIRSGFLAGAAEAGLQFADQGSALKIMDALHSASRNQNPIHWSDQLPDSSPWWFLLDRTLAPDGKTFLIYVQLPADQVPDLVERLEAEFPSVLVTGWSVMLRSLIPWAWQELQLFGFGVSFAVLLVLACVYRNGKAWGIHFLALGLSIALMVALIKILDLEINLLNVLALPLIIGVGVDYATHILMAAKETEGSLENLAGVIKPVLISGLTTLCGFGALILAENPSLSGLGAICVIGVGSCLLVSLLVVLPLSLRLFTNEQETG